MKHFLHVQDATGIDKTPATPTIPINRLRPYFRELSLFVFRAFQFGCLSRTVLDSHSVERDQELSLQPSQLIFLLQDLCSKLTSTFSTFGPRVGVMWVWFQGCATVVVCVCVVCEGGRW